ncbi:MAG: LysR family transcriptional regulator [Iphinoe sp. HA4291-MV1]|nr:LysR family transcriptional regulator [Iphinoe sp. HA4291-MV1]
MNQATLNQLKIFDAVIRYGSFNRAAKELFLSQPAISVQIKQLSESVGLPLFEKVGKRQSLTEAGQELLATCQEIFDSMARFEKKLANLKLLKQGKLRLAAFSTAKYIIPLTLGQFCQLYPGIDISLQLTNHSGIVDRMTSNLDDLYIMSQMPEDLDVNFHPLFEDSLVVVASVNHPLAKEKNIPMERLASELFIMREPGSGSRCALQKLLDEHGVALKVKLELGSNEAIQQVIADGLGISILSRHSLMSEPTNFVLTTLDVEHFPIQHNWYIAYPARKQLSIIARTYFEYLLDAVKQFMAPSASGGYGCVSDNNLPSNYCNIISVRVA